MEPPKLPKKNRKARVYQFEEVIIDQKEINRNARLAVIEDKIDAIRQRIADFTAKNEEKIAKLEASKIPKKRAPLTNRQKYEMEQNKKFYQSLPPAGQLSYVSARRIYQKENAAAAAKMKHINDRKLTKEDTELLRRRGIRGYRAGRYISKDVYHDLFSK